MSNRFSDKTSKELYANTSVNGGDIEASSDGKGNIWININDDFYFEVDSKNNTVTIHIGEYKETVEAD